MKVLILSTYEQRGGAAIAASRLLCALQKNGVEVSMLCRKSITWGTKGMQKQSWKSLAERAIIWVARGFKRKDLWSDDLALLGEDITKTQAYQESDVIHLHWINQGFLSVDTIRKILRSGKRVVWTMHDEWPLEGSHHYTYGQIPTDLFSKWVVARKRKAYKEGKITFVTCSQWLRDISLQKPLLGGHEIVSIPNAIDTSLFKPVAHKPGRRVLFVAQKVTDERKGVRYLDEAARMLDDVEIVALGRDLPYINDVKEMAALYASFDAFVTPSLSDNLPNTIMEAMACGTPCVGFNVGGIPEMIDHKQNGYVARYKDAADLAEGIRYVLDNQEMLGKAAREKVLRCYSEEAVAKRYVEVYEETKDDSIL